MPKAIIYTTITKKNLKYIIPRVFQLYKTANHHSLNIIKYYFDKPSCTSSFEQLISFLKKHKNINHIIINSDEEIINNESLFVSLLQLQRKVYVVAQEKTMVISL